MRVAYFTPVSPQKTGIADYSERELVPYLSKHLDLDIFIDEHIKPTNDFLTKNFNIYPYTEYEKREDRYDISLYHMGNNQFHEFIYNSLIKNPGIVILHDIYLHGFLWSTSCARGDEDKYISEFRYCHGHKGVHAAEKAIETGVYQEFEFPLIKKIVDNSLGIICHSEFGVKKVFEEAYKPPTIKINHPLTTSDETRYIKNLNMEKVKTELGLNGKYPIITSFGFISIHKRYTILFRAFKKFLQDYPNAVLLLIGADLIGIDKLISDLGLEQSVIKIGYISLDNVLEYLAISDFCINLRYPTAGETSGSALRIMAARKPLIVSNVGWFSELPDNCCLKVNVDSYEEDILLEYMKILASNEGLRELIGKNGQKYVLKEHNPEKVAKEYYVFIKNILNGNEFVLNKISEELSKMGVEEGDDEIIRYVSEKAHDLL